MITMLSTVFFNHGLLFASHPWEVIVASLTLLLTIALTASNIPSNSTQSQSTTSTYEGSELNALVFLGSILYAYYQLKCMYRVGRGSKLVVVVSLIYATFAAVIFSGTLLCLFGRTFAQIKDALPLFVLLVDIGKAANLAQYALTTATQDGICCSIAKGMAVIGPSMTLDTLVETLVIGVGTTSGVGHLESLATYAVLSALTTYLVFITFYPALLSLILEVSRAECSSDPISEEEPQANPVLQRVKVIMSAGLMIVHAHSRWPLLRNPSPGVSSPNSGSNQSAQSFVPSQTDSASQTPAQAAAAAQSAAMPRLYESVGGGAGGGAWWWLSIEQVIILGVALAIAIKYLFFERRSHLRQQFASAAIDLIEGIDKPHGKKSSQCDVIPDKEVLRSYRKHSSSEQDDKKRPSFLIGAEDFEKHDKMVQTDPPLLVHRASLSPSPGGGQYSVEELKEEDTVPRSIDECMELLAREGGPHQLTDREVIMLVDSKQMSAYKLESVLDNPVRGVALRRHLLARETGVGGALANLPFLHYDYSLVMGACCENVIGYMPVPVGVAGPLLLDGKQYQVPMATTEGCLIASTNRGCRAIAKSGGSYSAVVNEGMTRGPVVKLPSAREAAKVMVWLDKRQNFEFMKSAFDGTSRFARLQKLQCRNAGKYLFIRFVATTGDAMGMNMLSKGSEVALLKLQELFPLMDIISVSGNYCTDKKPAAVNWIEGRGKSVVCEATIPASLVKDILKTSAPALVEVNTSKNLIGSAIAGSIGGFNAQAANIVTAIYIATGQDPAQNVGSSNCLTYVECCGETLDDLYISCTMPSIEVGTVGGGTVLPAQGSMLELLGVRGASIDSPGENARTLARVVCGTVMAGELSLLSALAAGHLVKSHMRHNRSSINMNPLTPSLGSPSPGSTPTGPGPVTPGVADSKGLLSVSSEQSQSRT